MKTLNLPKTLFFSSLLTFLISFYLLTSFPNSGRYNLIAGVLFAMAITLNIAAYFTKKK